MPEPFPITAPCLALGAWAKVIMGSSTWVLSSPSKGTRTVPSEGASNHRGESEASGLPFVASEYPPSSALTTLTVAVRPSL